MKFRLLSLLLLRALACAADGAVAVSDASTAWTPLHGEYDYLVDQRTGQSAGDIVGVGTDYGFYITLNDAGSASSTDGTLGFRLRLDAAGGPTKKPSFDRVAWIGIDADTNGSIDAFLGLNLKGSSAEIGVYSPGAGLNTSPNTTSISSTPVTTYALTTSNYNYRPVNYLTDGGTTNDVTTSTSGDPDYYVSFMVPFADVVSFLAGRSIQITDQSALRFISATSTQTNSLNQDLGGVNGGVNSTTSWVDLGGFTAMVTANGTVVPEPSSILFSLLSFVATFLVRRRA